MARRKKRPARPAPDKAPPAPEAPSAEPPDALFDRLLGLRDRLAGYKIPRAWRVVDDFPRTAAGKVRKPELRKVLSGD